MKPYTISYTQREAGFVVHTNEKILFVDIDSQVKNIIKELKKERVVQGNEEVILADTPVKLMTKIHQLCSGTVKFESGRSMVFDLTKALYIRKKFESTDRF